MNNNDAVYDVAVIGGGPAGLTAALYASRAGKSAVVLERESFGGQIVYSPCVENYPGIPSVSGMDFSAGLCEQAEAAGAVTDFAGAEAIEKKGGLFEIRTDAGIRTARTVVLTTGLKNRRLGLEGEDRLIGRGVSYCAICDGAFYKGLDAAVVGGGNTALQDAIYLSDICASVALIHRRDEFRGDAVLLERASKLANVRIYRSCTVEALKERDGKLVGLEIFDKKSLVKSEIAVQGLFMAIGQVPHGDIGLPPLERDGAGCFIAAQDMSTAVPGLFVAGDCRSKDIRQLTTAVGDGATAAISACRYVDALKM